MAEYLWKTSCVSINERLILFEEVFYELGSLKWSSSSVGSGACDCRPVFDKMKLYSKTWVVYDVKVFLCLPEVLQRGWKGSESTNLTFILWLLQWTTVLRERMFREWWWLLDLRRWCLELVEGVGMNIQTFVAISSGFRSFLIMQLYFGFRYLIKRKLLPILLFIYTEISFQWNNTSFIEESWGANSFITDCDI